MLNAECRKWKSMYGAIWLMVMGVAGFLAVAADLSWKGQLYRWGNPIRYWFHEHSTPMGVMVCSAISGLGELVFLLPYGVVVGVLLWMKGRRREMVLWAAGLLGSAVINEVLKHIFRVPRPEGWTFYAFPLHAGYSFPSGHTMGVAIAAGMTVMVARRVGYLSRRGAEVAGMGAGVLTVIVGFSLMYVGVHTLVDVAGALGVSAGWLGVMAIGFGCRVPIDARAGKPF